VWGREGVGGIKEGYVREYVLLCSVGLIVVCGKL
jgi:hypothetical protein